MKWLIKFINGETPKVSIDIIKKPVHKYPAKVAKDNFRIKQFSPEWGSKQFVVKGDLRPRSILCSMQTIKQ